MKLQTLLAATVVALVGCANPGIVAMSQDTYLLSRADHAGIFGNAAAMKSDVIAEASRFAESKGKVAVPVALHETPNYPGHFATVEYQFRLVDPGSPAARGGSLTPIAPVQKSIVDVSAPTPKPDVYSELVKLDDLRKRGVLSDAEFEAQKRKLLSQ